MFRAVMNESVQYLNGSEGDFLKSLTFAFAMSFHSILEGFALGVQVGVFRLVQKMKLTPAIFLELQSRHPHSLPFSDNPQRNWSLLRWSASEPFQFQTFDVSCYNYFGVRINDPYWFDARRPSNSKFISARSRIDSKTTAKLGNSIKDQQLGHFSSRTRSFTLCVNFLQESTESVFSDKHLLFSQLWFFAFLPFWAKLPETVQFTWHTVLIFSVASKSIVHLFSTAIV